MENVLAVLNLGDLAQAFSKMGMFPVFDVAYYIVSILYLKYEPGERLYFLFAHVIDFNSTASSACFLLHLTTCNLYIGLLYSSAIRHMQFMLK